MIRRLLDTNICIAMIRGKADHAAARLRRRKLGTVGISSITLAELQHGVAKSSAPSRNAAALASFLAPIEILAFDQDAALAYGIIRADLERQGKPIGPMDMLIAAHAVSLKAVLVTHNTHEFDRIANLKIEDWLDTN